MALQFSIPAKNRALDGVVAPISTTSGTLKILQGSQVLVSFPDAQFPTAAANGSVTAAAMAPQDATGAGVADRWSLVDSLGGDIVSGDAGQRYQIQGLDRNNSVITVAGNRTSVFTPRAAVTLHNKNDTNQNVYVAVDNAGSSYNSVSDTTAIPIFEDLNSSPYSMLNWTHIHLGELGLDNTNIQVDQRVTVDFFRLSVK